jgi:hypothetical protein
MKSESLVVGRVYFMVTYHEPGLGSPIVTSYRYLGKDVDGTPVDPNDSGYHFAHLPSFHYCDPSENEEPDPCVTRHWFNEEQLRGLSDLEGLIHELAGLSEHWLKGTAA